MMGRGPGGKKATSWVYVAEREGGWKVLNSDVVLGGGSQPLAEVIGRNMLVFVSIRTIFEMNL